PASTDSRSSGGSSRLASQARPLTPNRSEHGGFGCSRRCKQAWISFLERVLARTSCSRRASRRRRIRQRSSGIHTASSSPFHSKLANARASSLSVLARALVIPVSSGETTTTRLTCGSRIRATSQQPPVTSNATRSDANKLRASDATPPGVAGTRPAERTSPSSQTATSQKSRCTSNPTARPTHLGSPILTSITRGANAGERAGKRHRPIRAQSSIQASRRGGRTKSTGSKPIDQNGLPVCVLPNKAPVPDQPNLRPDPDRASNHKFHASKSSSLGGAGASEETHQSRPRAAGCAHAYATGASGTPRAKETMRGVCAQSGEAARKSNRESGNAWVTPVTWCKHCPRWWRCQRYGESLLPHRRVGSPPRR